MPSRRNFIKAIGKGTLAVGAGFAIAGSATGEAAEKRKAGSAAAPTRVTAELAIPRAEEGNSAAEHRCDVLVIGGGFAGLNAAVAAGKAGQQVLLVDKGRPGYSGLSPFASSHRWFDKEMGDDAEAYTDCIAQGGEFLANLDWFRVWIEESKAAYQRLAEWKILEQYPKAAEAGDYVKSLDFVGYREKYEEQDRRTKFVQVLSSNGIQVLTRTMITDVVRQDGRVVGAMGFEVPSGQVLSIHAKAVILCTGGGSYKPSGFPTGSNSFDGEFIGYQLGLPIVGKEFDDFHQSVSYAPGNAFVNNSWPYLENIWLCGGDVNKENARALATTKAKIMVQQRVLKAVSGLANNDGLEVEDVSKADASRRGGTLTSHADDPRQGKKSSPVPKGDIFGAAVGMCAHLSSGIFCGLDDLVGRTSVAGLYVAGDGANGSVVTGAAYPAGVGFTSNFCSIQGWRAGQAAAQYAASAAPAAIAIERVAQLSEEIVAPLKLKAGLDANWARDVLQAIMAPYWIHITKSDKALRAALAQVEHLRDEVAAKLMAASAHDLRLCHEMKHKILSAEMKLRAGLERKESRGLHYRSDYPYRDDSNFLCYIAVRKGEDGTMKVDKVGLKEAWKGDLNEEYAKRYGWRFPGEARAKGLPEEKRGSGSWG